ncbi:MAG: TetR/AcrR family transcriptional regulator [Burkholderiales bacterium]|nr:TetR/AcrR family transcriptional regulator [Burkholderiales bacterium]MDE2274987.1 TetR/AcrR family transcriptional regulator [Burkholderiales bacterium]
MVNTAQTRVQPAAPPKAAPLVLPRRRLDARVREQQIVDGAAEFFARRGLEAQMRELAAELGIAHTLLYHYFPTKRALIERVYEQTIAGRWDARWEALLDDAATPAAARLQAFYREYLAAILTPEWLRILVHSGLSDGLIPTRYFALIRDKLFPRLLRLARAAAGSRSRAGATPREEALLMGFHGGLIYHLGIWPLVYQQPYAGEGDAALIDTFIADRIRGFLAQMPEVMPPAARPRAASRVRA